MRINFIIALLLLIFISCTKPGTEVGNGIIAGSNPGGLVHVVFNEPKALFLNEDNHVLQQISKDDSVSEVLFEGPEGMRLKVNVMAIIKISDEYVGVTFSSLDYFKLFHVVVSIADGSIIDISRYVDVDVLRASPSIRNEFLYMMRAGKITKMEISTKESVFMQLNGQAPIAYFKNEFCTNGFCSMIDSLVFGDNTFLIGNNDNLLLFDSEHKLNIIQQNLSFVTEEEHLKDLVDTNNAGLINVPNGDLVSVKFDSALGGLVVIKNILSLSGITKTSYTVAANYESLLLPKLSPYIITDSSRKILFKKGFCNVEANIIGDGFDIACSALTQLSQVKDNFGLYKNNIYWMDGPTIFKLDLTKTDGDVKPILNETNLIDFRVIGGEIFYSKKNLNNNISVFRFLEQTGSSHFIYDGSLKSNQFFDVD